MTRAPLAAHRHQLAGLIAGAGFESGDRLVVGHWHRSPIGPFSDLMWADASGRRRLLVPDDRAGAFVSAVYQFDEVIITGLRVDGDARHLEVVAPGVDLTLDAGRGRPIPRRRPAWFTRWVEGPIARAAMGVRTYGVSPTGVREWYRADAWHPVRSGRLRVDGRDRGALTTVWPPTGFGFSEPPRRPSVTRVRPLLVDPSGRLDRVVDRLTADPEAPNRGPRIKRP